MVRKGTCAKREGQHGFTLIEMSIVLAIIGLIVGGILKGSEVVNNGRLKMQVAQMDAVKAAIFTFQDQFTYLPGDYPTATVQLGFTGGAGTAAGAGANGDGNGTIGTIQGAGGTPAAAVLKDTDDTISTESVLVWAHLAAANLLQGVTLPPATSLKAVVPATALSYPGKMSGTFLWVASFNASVAGITGPMIRLQAPISGALTTASGQSVREPDAYNLDRKYDDGSPITGSILVDNASDQANCYSGGANGNGAYVLSPTGSPNTNYCTLLWIVQ